VNAGTIPVAKTPPGGYGDTLPEPGGVPIEVKRWLEGDVLMWQYIGFTCRLRRLGPPDTSPPEGTS